MTKTETPTLAEQRARAEAIGITVPEKATKAQITKLISEQEKAQEALGAPREEAPAERAPRRREVREPITDVTPRGDWLDPFSGLRVYFGDDINPTNGARRDGDEAVLWVTD